MLEKEKRGGPARLAGLGPAPGDTVAPYGNHVAQRRGWL